MIPGAQRNQTESTDGSTSAVFIFVRAGSLGVSLTTRTVRYEVCQPRERPSQGLARLARAAAQRDPDLTTVIEATREACTEIAAGKKAKANVPWIVRHISKDAIEAWSLGHALAATMHSPLVLWAGPYLTICRPTAYMSFTMEAKSGRLYTVGSSTTSLANGSVPPDQTEPIIRWRRPAAELVPVLSSVLFAVASVLFGVSLLSMAPGPNALPQHCYRYRSAKLTCEDLPQALARFWSSAGRAAYGRSASIHRKPSEEP